MSVLLIALMGIAVVLGGILLVRLHPLLSLLLGSLFILLFTPRAVLIENEFGKAAATVKAIDATAGTIAVDRKIIDGLAMVWHSQDRKLGSTPIQVRTAKDSQETVDQLDVIGAQDILATVHVGDRLIPTSELEAMDAKHWPSIGQRLAGGLADTFRKIGLPITMAAIIGVCLLESGAAARIIVAITALFGAQRTTPALAVSGFILGVPVFFDTVFYMLLPLAKAVGIQHPGKYLSSVMAIIVGATMAHSLVPPTPGPMLVASEMGVSIGMMMLGGTIVGGIAASVGLAYGLWCNRWMTLDLPEPAEKPQAISAAGDAQKSPIQAAPRLPILIAILPVALPLAMLGGSELLKLLAAVPDSASGGIWNFSIQSINWYVAGIHATCPWLSMFGEPGMALLCAALISIAIMRQTASKQLRGKVVGRGLSDAGLILLLTCAGGAFGASLQQLRLAQAVGEQFPQALTPWGLLLVAFLLTTIIRAAQGSATVAMITSSGIIGPLVASTPLPFHPVYVALAIGCGSKPLCWMNDSGFWQVCTMSGMTTSQTLRTFTIALTIMGIVGMGITLLGAWLFPLA